MDGFIGHWGGIGDTVDLAAGSFRGGIGGTVDLAAGSFRHKEPPENRGSGYVVESLEADLRAFDRSDSFEETVLRAANLGNDADTTAAVAGQLAGAYWGEEGIPERWLGKLAMKETITRLADALVVQAQVAGSRRFRVRHDLHAMRKTEQFMF